MAFLCPVRIGRSKKKKSVSGEIDKDLTRSNSGLGLNHGLGRITGSASIETLVRVGIEKEHGLSPDSKMVVLHDFTPCVDDELEVKRGQIVNILYRENDWVYVIGQDTRQEGFIPYSYCTPYNTQLADLAIKKKLPRNEQMLYFGNENGNEKGDTNANPNDNSNDTNNNNEGNSNNNEHNTGNINNKMNNPISGDNNEHNTGNLNNKSNNPPSAAELIELSTTEILDDNTMSGLIGLQNSMLKHSQASLSSDQDYIPFAKDICGRYIVLYTFIARDENDVSVERGEFVTVLNREDPEWFWIVRSDGQEGFIPSGFVYPADNILQNNTKPSAQNAYNSAMNQLNDARQLQNPVSVVDPIATNDPNTCQTHNLQMATGMGHTNAAIADQASVAINSGVNVNSNTTSGQVQVPSSQQQQSNIGGSDDLRYHGTELVMLYDYKAQAPDDLSVRRGDWIYADLNNQTVDGWLWAFAPKTRNASKYGFIPKAYARTPAMTSL